MARADLITVAQMKQALAKLIVDLEAMDESKPINLAFMDEEGRQVQVGFVTKFEMEAHPSMDEEQLDVNVDINYVEA